VTDQDESDDGDGEPSRAARIDSNQKDAFYTLGRQASISLESAQYPGTPIKLQDGTTGIRASAKVKKTIEICKRIVEEDKALPIEKRRKVCVSMRWTSGFPVLQYHLPLAGLGSVTLSGSNTAQERDAIVQKISTKGPASSPAFNGHIG
jgi:hypothetical protein